MSRYQQQEDVSLSVLVTMIKAAQDEVVALCQGNHRWRMSIPVDNADSDMVIGDALRHALALTMALLANGYGGSLPLRGRSPSSTQGNEVRRAQPEALSAVGVPRADPPPAQPPDEVSGLRAEIAELRRQIDGPEEEDFVSLTQQLREMCDQWQLALRLLDEAREAGASHPTETPHQTKT